jgi:hypothetical protein
MPDTTTSTSGAVPAPRAPVGGLLGQAQELIDVARATLDGNTGLPPRRRTRAAALFARTALELAVNAHLAAAGHDLPGAGMRVRLICLYTLVDRDVGQSATIAWAGLSSGCHQHAYELSPTWSEVSHLIDLVESVLTVAVAANMSVVDGKAANCGRAARDV